MVRGRALEATRARVAEELAALLHVPVRRSAEQPERLSFEYLGRSCEALVWGASATIELATLRTIIPIGILVEESSVWGPQKWEAWQSGEAVRTGDPSFDNSFIVLGTQSAPTPAAVSLLSPESRALLIRYRSEIRDANVTAERIALPVRAHRPVGLLRTLGAAVLGRQYEPTGRDVEDSIRLAVRLAEELEALQRED